MFAIMVGLLLTFYNGLASTYELDNTDTVNDMNIMVSLENLDIIIAMNQSLTGIYELSAPTGTVFDIVGALASTGIGVIKLVIGLLKFPFQILGIINLYYPLPGFIITGLLTLLAIYIGFIMLSAYLKGDI